MYKIVGKRVFLRQIEHNDFLTFLMLKQDKFINKYMYWPDKSDDEVNTEFNNLLQEINKNDTEKITYDYFVCLVNTNEIIGFVSIKTIFKNEYGGLGDIGYFLRESYCHHGYAKESINLLINNAFNSFGFHKLSAFPFTENKNSITFLERNYFNKEAVLEQEAYINNEWKNVSIYSVYKNTWQNSNYQNA